MNERLVWEDYNYRILQDGTVEITKYNGEATTLEIPQVINGRSVSSIWINALFYCEGLLSIGSSAFACCSRLTSVSIPDSVISMDANPFIGCSGLSAIYASPDQPCFSSIDGVLFEKSKKKLICYPMGKADSSYAIPQGIAVIGNAAFSSCSGLISVSIPDSVISIGDQAFADCSGLTSVSIPDSVTSIGDRAFCRCESLTSISIPDSVTSIGNMAFDGCSGLTSVSIPDSVTSIGKLAFYQCKSLTSVSIPDSVTAIGANPFKDCSKLTTISVSPDQPYFACIDGVLFEKKTKKLICYPMRKEGSAYAIPQGVSVIGDSAFSDCYNLTSVSIPDSVTSIGDRAFDDCFGLTSVSIPDSVTSIGEYAFPWYGNLTLTVPRGSYAAQYCQDNDLPYTYTDAYN